MSMKQDKFTGFSRFILLLSISFLISCGSNDKQDEPGSIMIKTISDHIDRVGDVNTQNEAGFLPLTYASYFGDRDAVFYVLQEGADPNQLDEFGFAPLHWAASKGQIVVIDDLLNFGGSIDIKTSYGETPLFLAMKNKENEIARLLIDRGADLGVVTSYNKTMYSLLEMVDPDLQQDISQNYMGIAVKSISDYPRTNNDNLNRSLRVAASEGRTEDVLNYLSEGANINARSAFGRTALLFAAQNGHFETVRALLAYREMELETKDRYNKGAAQYALENGYPHISEFIEMAVMMKNDG